MEITLTLNTEAFESALYDDGEKCFRQIIKDKGEGLYVIGFYHLGGWDGVMPMFNTIHDLAPLQKVACGDDQKEAELQVKWAPIDFPSLETYYDYFDRSVEEIQKLPDQFHQSSEDKQLYWQQTLKAMVSVLVKLDANGVFSQSVDRESLTLYIATYDEDYVDRFERVKVMNPPSVINKIAAEFEYMIAVHARWQKEVLDEYLRELDN